MPKRAGFSPWCDTGSRVSNSRMGSASRREALEWTPLGHWRTQVWEAGSGKGWENSAGFGIPSDLYVLLTAWHVLCPHLHMSDPVFFVCFFKINTRSALFIYLFIWVHRAACGIIVPRPGTKPAVEAQRLNHWTARVLCVMGVLLDSPRLWRVVSEVSLSGCGVCRAKGTGPSLRALGSTPGLAICSFCAKGEMWWKDAQICAGAHWPCFLTLDCHIGYVKT